MRQHRKSFEPLHQRSLRLLLQTRLQAIPQDPVGALGSQQPLGPHTISDFRRRTRLGREDFGDAVAAQVHDVCHGAFHGPGALAHAPAGERNDQAPDVVADGVDPLHQPPDAVDEILFLVDAAFFAAGSLALLAPAVLGRFPRGVRAHGAGAVRVPCEQRSAARRRRVGRSQGDVVGNVAAAVDVAVEE